jgi:hypothetical protein
MSKILTLRLRDDEVEMLARCCRSEEAQRNPSELLRLLLHREYYRRTTGKSVVAENTISSEWRTGRPRQVASKE